MGHIKPQLLIDTVTIYNVWKNTVSGTLLHYRTFLKNVRMMDKKSAVNISNIGWTQIVTQQVLMDAQNTTAYSYNDSDQLVRKKYIARNDWIPLSDEEKGLVWTLQEGDYLVLGECEVVIPPDPVSKLTELHPRKIQNFVTIRQKLGALNHWEVNLV